MNHADFCVIPKARCNSQDEIPLRLLATSHIAVSHLSRPSAESSMMVPDLRLNCRRGWRLEHCQRLCLGWNLTLSLPQVGQMTPLDHRRGTTYSRQLSWLEKVTTAS